MEIIKYYSSLDSLEKIKIDLNLPPNSFKLVYKR